MKFYKKGDRIPARAQQIWLILTAHAVLKPDGIYEEDSGWSGWGKGLISYGDLAVLMGMDKRAAVTLSKHLGVIGYYCKQEGLPPLNVIAVNDETGEPGFGVVETSGFEKDQMSVWDARWFSYRPPTIRALRAVYDEHFASSN
ncbi:hypothetical protein [Ruegeria sp. HKCCD6119]|uniref:hypothetical protein n=1 Tax=Ruegeria sp. HKCCD6119 TaxID=2683003 RepID=UPI001492929D|nr:hypothetical protein [Ruegeria sp. HKCCD6119]NOD84026.1 hypothetical protein [Ruegeria sp. HKCCD6119]